MTRRRILTSVILLLLILPLHCRAPNGGDKGRQEPSLRVSEEGTVILSPEAIHQSGIKTARVQVRRPSGQLTATGTIDHNQNRLAHVGSRIPARVVEIRADLGKQVEPGEVLAILDSPELGEAKAAYVKAKVLLEVARSEYEREERLFQQKISAEREMLRARSQHLKAQAEISAARGKLILLGVSEKEIGALQAGNALPASRFPLASPIAGTVVVRNATLGKVVTPERELFTVSDLSSLWTLLDIYEKDLARIREGQEVTLTVNAYPERRWTGRVTYMGDIVERESRTVKVRVQVENTRGLLKPGMFATASIATEGGEAEEVLTVSPAALQRSGEGHVVFVQVSDNNFLPRKVTVGRQWADEVEIIRGLQPGEVVVTEGSFVLKSEWLKEAIGGEE